MNRDGSCPLPNTPRPFWISTKTYTARCGEGTEGSSVTVTQQFKSFLSEQHATNEARRLAKCLAEAAIVCNTLIYFSTATAYKQCYEAGTVTGVAGSTISIEWITGTSLPEGAKIKIADDIFTVVSTDGDLITVEGTASGEVGASIFRVFPFVGSGASSVSQEIADERAVTAAEAGAALIACPNVQVFYSTATVELTCPGGAIGEPSSATVTATSAVSQAAADAAAMAQATEEAEAGLICGYEGSASYTAHSQAGGSCTSLTVEKTAFSTISVEDAEAIALAEAIAEAEATLNGGAPATETTHTYVSDGDSNGVAYFRGTNDGTSAWTNPVTAGRLGSFVYPSLIYAGFNSHDYFRVFNRTIDDLYTSGIGASFGIDLGEKRQLRVSAYSQRGYAGPYAIRNWKLQGCFCIPGMEVDQESVASRTAWNAADWQDLDVHVNDAAQTVDFQWATFSGLSDPRFFRYFRIVQTGLNANPGDPFYNALMFICELEFYVTLRTYP